MYVTIYIETKKGDTMKDKSFQLKGKAEHTEEGSSKVERFHIQPNRISQLWWKAQRLVKLADVHNELSYESFTDGTNAVWEALAKEQGLDIHDKELYKEPSTQIPVDEHGNEIGEPEQWGKDE